MAEPTQIRTAEIQDAQQNPAIVSNLSGVSSPQPMQPQAQPTSAPSMFGQAGTPEMAQALQKGQALGQELYGGQFYKGTQGQSDAAQRALFEADKALDAKFSGASSFPQYDWYVNNPADEFKGFANFTSGAADVANTLSGTLSTTDQAYRTAMQSVMDKFLDFLRVQEERKRDEERSKWEREKFEREQNLAERELNEKIKSGQTDQSFWSQLMNTAGVSPEIANVGESEWEVVGDSGGDWEVVEQTPSATTQPAPARDPIGKAVTSPVFKNALIDTAATMGGPVTGGLNLIRKLLGR